MGKSCVFSGQSLNRQLDFTGSTSLGWLVEVVRLSPADVAMRVDLDRVEIAAGPWNQDLNIFPLGERGAAGHVGRVTAVVFVGGRYKFVMSLTNRSIGLGALQATGL